MDDTIKREKILKAVNFEEQNRVQAQSGSLRNSLKSVKDKYDPDSRMFLVNIF